jgi:hypothetical protein
MRNLIFLIPILLLLSCKKEDTTSPIVTLNGTTPVFLYMGDTYMEQGAKAEDDKDGDVSSTITISGSVNTAQTGSYALEYTANDNSGNEGNATRYVIVKNKADSFSGTYSVKDSIWGGSVTVYQDYVSTSSSTNSRIQVTRFGNQVNGAVYMDLVGNATGIQVPLQTIMCGNPPALTSFSTPNIGGVISTSPIIFTFHYQKVVNSVTTDVTATYTKQ